MIFSFSTAYKLEISSTASFRDLSLQSEVSTLTYYSTVAACFRPVAAMAWSWNALIWAQQLVPLQFNVHNTLAD